MSDDHEGYLSEDQDLTLRALAPNPCRVCQLYWAKVSLVTTGIQAGCLAVDETAPNADILVQTMLRLAKLENACPSQRPFSGTTKPLG